MSQISSIDFFVLCGGLGKRLRDVIGESQKVMAKIDDEPFLNILLKYIAAQGGRRVILGTGYKSDEIESYYKENNFGLDIKFSTEDEPLGTGGGVKHAQAKIQSDPFFALNGDSLVPVDYQALLDFYTERQAKAVLVTKKVKESKECGVITLDNTQAISSFQEKIDVKSQDEGLFISTGVYCLSQNIFDDMPQDDKFSIEYDFFPTMVGKKFYGFEIEDEFLDIGIPERYKQAQEKYGKENG